MLRLSIRMAPPDTASNVRRAVLALSVVLAIIGTYWIGRAFTVDGRVRFGNPVESSGRGVDSFDREPRQVRAEIIRVTGAQLLRPGDKCEFLIERRPSENASPYCSTQVVCGGRLVFGGPNRGFFACRFESDHRRDVVGSEPVTSGRDGDSAFYINTAEGLMRVWDDEAGMYGAFQIEADVLSVQ
jgi:hypothetical protein